MRYLVASDLHYRLPQLDWIADQAAEFDAVVLVGDHLDLAGHVDLGAQIALMKRYFARLAETTRVVVNSGNHDLSRRGDHGEKLADWLLELDDAVVTDGQRLAIGPDLVSSCAWWEGPTTKQAVVDQLRADAEHRPADGTWVWAYHSPPDRSPTSWSGRRYYGDELLNELLTEHRPDVVLTGHVHEAPLRPDGSWFDTIGDTVVLNAGRQSGPVPAHIIIDTAEGEARWWTFEAGEHVVALAADAQ